MTEIYEGLLEESDEYWLSGTIDYTFLNFLPDYYLTSSGYATWYDAISDTSEGVQSFSNKQKQAIKQRGQNRLKDRTWRDFSV